MIWDLTQTAMYWLGLAKKLFVPIPGINQITEESFFEGLLMLFQLGWMLQALYVINSVFYKWEQLTSIRIQLPAVTLGN